VPAGNRLASRGKASSGRPQRRGRSHVAISSSPARMTPAGDRAVFACRHHGIPVVSGPRTAAPPAVPCSVAGSKSRTTAAARMLLL
jgi:hypothetical protein